MTSIAKGTRSRSRPHVTVAKTPIARKHKYIRGAAREKVAAEFKKKYESGASIRALAEEIGRSYGFVHRMLSDSGVNLRARGGGVRKTPTTPNQRSPDMSDPKKIAKFEANLAGIETQMAKPDITPVEMAHHENLAQIVEKSIAIEKAKP